MTTEPTDCPVRVCAERATALSQDLVIALRALRRSLRKCALCQEADSCWLLQEWHAQITAAISEVAAEWNLG
jgi:hypothetical protein